MEVCLLADIECASPGVREREKLMRTFQFVPVNGSTPYERGKQYGEQAERKIRSGIEGYRALFAQTSGRSWEETERYALSYIPLIERVMPDQLEEATGIAKGAGVSLGELMVLNCRYEITKFPQSNECTTCAVLPEASEGGKTLLAKNWDYRAGILDNIVVLHITESDGTQIIGLTEAGQLIREGFNSHGIGLCNNALQSVQDTMGVGIPVTFLRRKVFTCTTFEEARDLLLNTRRTVSNNMLLASKDGQAVDIESYPGGGHTIDPMGGIVTHANHFVVNPALNALEGSPRDDRLRELLERKRGAITIDYIKKCMCDHENYPKAICRHPSDVDMPLARRGMTVASMIVDFEDAAVHICAGPPCEGDFMKFSMA